MAERDRGRRTTAGLRRGVAFAALVATLALIASLCGVRTAPAVAADGSWTARARSVAEGVEHVELVRKGSAPNVVNVARVSAGADVRLEAVLAHDVVDRRDESTDRETTSSMCGRAGATVCVNGDFALCFSCGQPFGGVVRDGRVLRSFRSGHEQVSLVDGRLRADPQAWSGKLLASYTTAATLTRPARTETREIPLDGLNVDPIADGAVLYTPEWGVRTPIVGGSHLRLSTAAPVAPGSIDAHPLALHDEEQVDLGGEVIVSADGARSEALGRFWEEWNASTSPDKHLAVVTQLASPASVSIGGHPRLLADGQRLALNDADPKVHDRHPRTLVGWDAAGEMLLVTVDGRHRSSQGVTLHEATDLLIELGATDGMNLDGGGSSTFVAPCDRGLCVENRPSGGSERQVPVALALIAKGAAPAPAPVETPAPAPQEPPAEPDPASEPPALPPPPPPPPTPVPLPPPTAAPEPVTVVEAAPEPEPAVDPVPVEAPDPGVGPEVLDTTGRRDELAAALAASEQAAPVPPTRPQVPPALPAAATVLLAVTAGSAVRVHRTPRRPTA